MFMVGETFDVVVEAEDRASKEESLGDVHQSAGGDGVDLEDLVTGNGNTADDEQYGHCVLGDVKSGWHVVF